MINPVQEVNQLLICALSLLILAGAWRYRDRVIYLFTGDDRLHIGALDLIWFWCCRCGGFCDGEWTRKISGNCGGGNLKTKLGRKLGILSIPVEVSNIVAGDLPFSGKGDFYLSVEVGENPPMTTSITENCSAKVVHFGQTLTVRVRESILENQIRFVVKELNVFGSQDIAEIRFQPMRFCDWLRRRPHKVMRFQMDNIDSSHDSATPAWIAFELGPQAEYRGTSRFTVHLKDTITGKFDHMKSREFKYAYKLIDRTGELTTQDADKDNSEQIAKIMARRKAEGCCVATWVLIIVFGAIGWRLYLWKCWKEFRELTQRQKGDLVNMPSHDEILQVCESTTGTARPVVFNRWAHEYWGGHSLPCFHGVCQVRDSFVTWRVPFFIALFILVCFAMYYLTKKPDIAIRKDDMSSSDEEDYQPRALSTSGNNSRTLDARPETDE